jgi:predicted aminopeptidase
VKRQPVLVALLAVQGCFPARYVAQAAGGQLGILRAARPIPEVVTGREVEPDVARLLLAVGEVKRFGEQQGLRATPSYERYADLRRPAAVWVVQACAPLAFQVRHWRMPVVGTIPYLGFFDEQAARRHGEAVARDEGLDVEVRGASAYSTLGWFDDPVLSTMMPKGDEALGELADVVLHESVHATHYVNGQSPFNESLASFVAVRLARAWLVRAAGPESAETLAWIRSEERRRSRIDRLHRAYLELDALYRSTAADAEKQAGKARVLADAAAELKLRRPLNNAALAGFKTYDSGAPAFERLLRTCGGSWPRFLRAVRTVREADFARGQQAEFEAVVDRAAAAACGTAPAVEALAR